METSQNRLPNGPGRAKICKVCGKEGQSMGIRDHIEANHLEGVSLPCNVCGQKVLCNKLSHRVVGQLIAQNPSRCKLLQIFCAITPYCTEQFCAITPYCTERFCAINTLFPKCYLLINKLKVKKWEENRYKPPGRKFNFGLQKVWKVALENFRSWISTMPKTIHSRLP